MWKATLCCILSTMVISTLARDTPKFALPRLAKQGVLATNPESQMLIDAIKSTMLVLKEQFSNTNHSEVVKNVSALGFDNFVQNT